ncbi:MAG: cupin domain-containing protein [Gemmatimonadetes bacterium]|nr:cupin domain-containing protein [Gemmatimonadota bacterium]
MPGTVHGEGKGAHHVIVADPGTIKWAPAPASLPAGARVTLLDGDPAQPGPFTMRLWMPDGYRIPPHFHPGVERITVISGTFLLGTGDRFDASGLNTMETGAYASMGAGMRHFVQTRGETVVQLNNIGPWALHYVNPADDPRNAPKQ